MTDLIERCMMPFAQTARKRPRSLSNHQKTDLCIAETVIRSTRSIRFFDYFLYSEFFLKIF